MYDMNMIWWRAVKPDCRTLPDERFHTGKGIYLSLPCHQAATMPNVRITVYDGFKKKSNDRVDLPEDPPEDVGSGGRPRQRMDLPRFPNNTSLIFDETAENTGVRCYFITSFVTLSNLLSARSWLLYCLRCNGTTVCISPPRNPVDHPGCARFVICTIRPVPGDGTDSFIRLISRPTGNIVSRVIKYQRCTRTC